MKNRNVSLVLLLAVALFAGCGKSPSSPVSVAAPGTVTAGALRLFYGQNQPAKTSEALYAQVDESKLPAFYAHFLTVYASVSGQNAPHWDVMAECTAFAGLLHEVAKAEYPLVNFYNSNPPKDSAGNVATAPAIGVFWYTQAATGKGHAIVTGYGTKGRFFLEPQPDGAGNLQFLTLQQSEIDGAILCEY